MWWIQPEFRMPHDTCDDWNPLVLWEWKRKRKGERQLRWCTPRTRRDGRWCLRGCSSCCRHLFNWEPTWSWHPSRSAIPSTSTLRNSCIREREGGREREKERERRSQKCKHLFTLLSFYPELWKIEWTRKRTKISWKYYFVCAAPFGNNVSRSRILEIVVCGGPLLETHVHTTLRAYSPLLVYVSCKLLSKAYTTKGDCEIFYNQTWPPPDQPSTKQRRCEIPGCPAGGPVAGKRGLNSKWCLEYALRFFPSDYIADYESDVV